MNTMKPTVIWSVAGTDSGGGAGLAADQRAADAAGVHLCPVVAAITAQNTVAVTRVDAVASDLLDAQLAALAADLPPTAIKTGLLGSVANVLTLVRWVDALRARAPLTLVVDPVLRASTGASFADPALIVAYREHLLPRATVITPNRREAARLLGRDEPATAGVPALAAALQALGPATVCVTGGDAADTLAHDWLASPQAQGWLTLPRRANRRTQGQSHGTGCCFATALAAALARGFVAADAAVLAKMLTTAALGDAASPGQGAGPVRPRADFIRDRSLLPHLSLGASPPSDWPTHRPAEPTGLYAIADSAEQAVALMRAGLRTVQLRIKRPPAMDEVAQGAWQRRLHAATAQAQAAAAVAGATLVVNDHWQAALAHGARAVHLGQEDLLALTPDEQHQLATARAAGLRLGLSTHSLWELCRAAALQPDYIACGPVWPTLTKAMPWRPQGLRNLAWWVALSPAPVVAIGGILAPAQLQTVAALGVGGACVVRGLQPGSGYEPAAWIASWQRGQQCRQPDPGAVCEWPLPCLPT